jgi:hypothetical protein
MHNKLTFWYKQHMPRCTHLTRYANESVTISGGVKLDVEWESYKLPGNISSDVIAYSAKLPEGSPLNFTTLFASGQRAIRAR